MKRKFEYRMILLAYVLLAVKPFEKHTKIPILGSQITLEERG